MSKIKATDGREFEIVDTGAYGHMALMEVKQEPKWQINIKQTDSITSFAILPLGELSEDQAQLIREAVEELMEDITGRDDQVSHLVHRINKARQSIMRENN